MKEENTAIEKNAVCFLANFLTGTLTIATKLVFQIKQNENGSLYGYTARLVAKSFLQCPVTDCGNIYAPVIKYSTLCLFLEIVTQGRLKILHIDVR